MNQFETSATVSGQGEIHLAGVPFVPGTSVEVTVREKVVADASPPMDQEHSDRVRKLFAALDTARNTESVGPLRREELYDRKVFR
jgi:antitoxin (DNA-binding transcriptional repressor) of toxin-antitoxin stability system